MTVLGFASLALPALIPLRMQAPAPRRSPGSNVAISNCETSMTTQSRATGFEARDWQKDTLFYSMPSPP